MPDDDLSPLLLQVAGALTTASVAGPVIASFDADITDVVAVVGTAPTGADLVFDILKNGTSIFAAALGTLAVKSPIGTTDTTIYFEQAGNAQLSIEQGQVLLIGSEKLLVSGQVTASSKVDGATPVYAIPVTRGYDGSTAATAVAGASVFAAKPFIPASATKSSLVENPAWALQTSNLVPGDVLTLTVSQIGSSVAGSNLSVDIEMDRR